MSKPADRYDLPYGIWICADGTAYLFNRRYQPIWKKRPGKKAEPADRKAWISFVTEFHFWSDSCDVANSPKIAAQMRFIRDRFINHLGLHVGPTEIVVKPC